MGWCHKVELKPDKAKQVKIFCKSNSYEGKKKNIQGGVWRARCVSSDPLDMLQSDTDKIELKSGCVIFLFKCPYGGLQILGDLLPLYLSSVTVRMLEPRVMLQ